MVADNVDGSVEQRFEGVRRAFADNFAQGLEIGASACVTVDGKTVVDLWGGWVDAAKTKPWTQDTIANVYSTTKGMVATCAAMLADRGELDVNAPVVNYWPEFGQAGKQNLLVRHLLSHQAGMAAVREDLPTEAFWNWEMIPEALARQEPWWEPGTAHGYHAITYGHLVGEVIRRITGKTPGTFFREEVAEPLGADFWIGLPAEHDARVAEIVPAPADPDNPLTALLADPATMAARAIVNPPGIFEVVNTRDWRGGEVPAANGHGNARSVARVYTALACDGEVDGVRLLSKEGVAAATAEQGIGEDLVLGMESRWALGFGLPSALQWLGPNPNAFGHSGAGGSLGFADPAARVSFGYVMNKMGPGIPNDPRTTALIKAVYDCV